MYLVVQILFLCDNPYVTGKHVSQTRVCMYVCVVTKITRVCDDKLTFTAQRLPYLTPGLTFTDSAFCPHSVFMFFTDLRTNSDYFTIHHLLVGFYNRGGKCLLRGTDWVF